MEKQKNYERTRFSEDILRSAALAFRSHVPLAGNDVERTYLVVDVDGAEWTYDAEEEFFADYRRSAAGAVFQIDRPGGRLRLQAFSTSAHVSIRAWARPQVEAISAVFEQAAERCALPKRPEPRRQDMESRDIGKERRYERTRFSEDVLRLAASEFRSQVPLTGNGVEQSCLTVEVDGAEWTYNAEEEFFADYRRSAGDAVFQLDRPGGTLRVQASSTSAKVRILAPARPRLEAISAVFEQAAERCALPEPPEPPPEPVRPTIFIGHGRSTLWRDLKDHLHEKHGYSVAAYEIGARAGHAIRDVLEQMLAKSAFALLVMTGEDETADGKIHARQNVVHETGLFQGRLGFGRAVVLLEEGTEEFSNIHGLEQIRFSKGNIKETFGDVLATIRREFPA
ncbi:MAG: nucleotide-binding protein [Candidatus Binatia bacterium]|jgi:hypothetical protein